MTKVAFLTFFLFLIGGFAIISAFSDSPANDQAVITLGKARFSVLFDELIRMEYGTFRDGATMAVQTRNVKVPNFSLDYEGDVAIITTSKLTLRYDTSSSVSFNSDNLEISLTLPDGTQQKWSPVFGQDQDVGGNLLGTVRTLDGSDGSNINLDCYNNNDADSHCALGLVSRDGFVVLDDTNSAVWDEDEDWSWPINQTTSSPSMDDDTCSSIPDEERIDCGYPSISEKACHNKGCCFDGFYSKVNDKNLGSGISQCFFSTQADQDMYFFGYGWDYKKALNDYTKISGKIPLPPKFVFGIWFSRYWAWMDQELLKITRDHQDRSINLDVLVHDMDAHLTFYSEFEPDQAGQRKGWTGFTYDPNLFPSPDLYHEIIRSKNLRSTFNNHPASGIQPWEDTYEAMAQVMGIDPTSEEYVPFVSTDKFFMENWMEITLKPLEVQESSPAFDFWWLDWQQGEQWITETDNFPNLNPTMMLNYAFFTSPFRWSYSSNRPQTDDPMLQDLPDRPLIFHRWGGYGNHRYQIGFSGDVVPSWDSLSFQVLFTIRASNVLFSYWSHDLGGHTQPSPSELYTRWVQFGAFSPVFRTHCTKDAGNDRRIWTYPNDYFEIMRDFIKLRSLLVPYLYTASFNTHHSGLGIVHGLYFDYPERDESYDYDKQYFFGDDFLVAPAVEELDLSTNLTKVDVYIPDGVWFDFFSGIKYEGPIEVERYVPLNEMPVFAKAGAVIPMKGPFSSSSSSRGSLLGGAAEIEESLRLEVASPQLEAVKSYLYEDDGMSVGYQNHIHSKTFFSSQLMEDLSTIQLSVSPTRGSFTQATNVFPSQRSYEVVIRNVPPATKVIVNEEEASVTHSFLLEDVCRDGNHPTSLMFGYNGNEGSLIILTPPMDTAHPTNITISLGLTMDDETIVDGLDGGFRGYMKRFLTTKQVLDNQWGTQYEVYQDTYPTLVSTTEKGMRISYSPSSFEEEMKSFQSEYETSLDELNALQISEETNTMLNAQLTSPINKELYR